MKRREAKSPLFAVKKFAVSDLFRNFAPDYEVSLHLTMKYLVGIIILVVSLLLSCTDGERMRRELAGLQARNQADSLLSNLIAMSNAYVSVARKKLLKNIFKTDGSAKEFDIKIREIT